MENQNPPTQKVYFRKEAQGSLVEGARTLAAAVGSTMGPSGHSVIIDLPGGPKITKDGVTVARSINLSGKLESVGAELLKEIASKTNDVAGDGTTTATVLGFNLLNEGNKMISTGRSAIHLKQGMDLAGEIVKGFLEEHRIPLNDENQIASVATISANGDKEIGELIAKAIRSVGTDGLIAIENGKSIDTNLKLAEGIQIDSGYLSPWFVTNSDKQVCELDNPYVLVTPNKISSISQIVPVLEQIDKANRPLLIVADDVEGEALHTLVVNKTKGVIKVCAIKAPAYGEFRADILNDLGVVVDGVVLGATSELSIEKIRLENLGTCKRAVINRNSCMLIVDENKPQVKDNITNRINSLKETLKNDTTLDDLRRNKCRSRLAKLSGGVAVIEVGGSTEVEVLEKKDRVEDAVNATQAATQEGIVPGGGTALFYAAQHLHSLLRSGVYNDRDDDFKAGIQTVALACESPFRTIVSNTGKSPDVVAEKLKQNWVGLKGYYIDIVSMDEDSTKEFIDMVKSDVSNKKVRPDGKNMREIAEDFNLNFRTGYNASNHSFGDLVGEGIIDPVKVTRLALEHAISVVGLMLTCNAVIVNEDNFE